MGTKTIFQVLDGESNLIATLFANSSHTKQFAEAVFEHAIKDCATQNGPNALVEKLLSVRYESAEGNHDKGDRIFWLVAASEDEQGDWDTIIRITHCGSEEFLTKGYVKLNGPAWSYERQEFEA